MSEYKAIGLDLGDQSHHFCVIDAQGEELERGTVKATKQGLAQYFETLPPAHIALEAGSHSPWVSCLLEQWGHDVWVGNPRKLRMIWGDERKCDERDAMMLARLVRFDPQLLSPIRHRSPAAQVDLKTLKARDILVATRTKLVSHVRDAVKTLGERLPNCSTEAFVNKAGGEIPQVLRETLAPVLEVIADLTQKIRDYDKRIEQLSEQRYPETARLRQIAGVGPLTALAFVLTLEQSERFVKSRQVGAFLGLVPRRDQSGKSDRALGITKTGDPFMRKLLVSASHYILGVHGPDCELRRWGLSLAERGGAHGKKRAVVALARKLSGVLHHLWASGEDYQAFPEPPKRRRGKRKQQRGQATASAAMTG